jgi:hypothetical protein
VIHKTFSPGFSDTFILTKSLDSLPACIRSLAGCTSASFPSSATHCSFLSPQHSWFPDFSYPICVKALLSWCPCKMPLILATQEAEIRMIKLGN